MNNRRLNHKEFIPKLFKPVTFEFVIFWLPIVIPLLIAACAFTVSDITTYTVKEGKLQLNLIPTNQFITLLAKNAHLSFLSTDLWAVTTAVTYVAKKQHNAFALVPVVFGAIIALFVHLFFYLLVVVMGNLEPYSVIVSVVTSLIGFVGVFLVRYSVYAWIDYKDQEGFGENPL